ncbi:peptide ABC transporter permease [Clostridia bacterium]|nr:peptide ABC transporter permease [Clostridia bacterium]
MAEQVKITDGLDALFVPHPFSAEETEKIEYSNYSYWRSTLRTFGHNPIGMAALSLMLLLVLFAVLEQFFPNAVGKIAIENNYKPYDYIHYLTNSEMWKITPTAQHWFGTDEIGRDLWARAWFGTRISLELAFIVAAIELVVGFIVGAVWGYVRSVDKFMIEIYNAISNIPTLILYVLMIYILSPSFTTLIIAMSMFGWLGTAKYIRNLVFIIRDREFNLASKCLGTPINGIIRHNLLPHLLSVVMLRAALLIVAVISAEVVLTFLGIGLPQTIPSLGVLITVGRSYINFRPHMMLFPTIIVSLITISFYVVGNAISDASDPKNHV